MFSSGLLGFGIDTVKLSTLPVKIEKHNVSIASSSPY